MPREYLTGYPTEKIGRGNPYYRCAHCKVSEPQINGNLHGHSKDCEWRLAYVREYLQRRANRYVWKK